MGIQEWVMFSMLLVVAIGYLIDRFAGGAPDRGTREQESERRGEF